MLQLLPRRKPWQEKLMCARKISKLVCSYRYIAK